MRPFLKWAGGKRWIASRLAGVLELRKGRYVEPFLGSGAVFFALEPKSALLADVNPHVVAAFKQVRRNPEEVAGWLEELSISRRTFDDLRSANPRQQLAKAVRLIYLNKTAFNGLYRVNREGIFNVPFGCKPTTVLCDSDCLDDCSSALSVATIKCRDFRQTLSECRSTDRIYIDPPYTVTHNDNCFRRYNESFFSWDDQEELARLVTRLASRGAGIVMTNALHERVRALYSRSLFRGFALTRATNMAASSARRGVSQELLLVSRSMVPKGTRLAELLRRDLSIKAEGVSLSRACKPVE